MGQEEWKEQQSDARKKAIRRAVIGQEDEGDEGSKERGILGGAGKEDSWMLSLLGIFGGGGHGRDVRQDTAMFVP